ncbi:MAG: DUF4458 domain-containing protein [Bacteroidales bacterium]|nr:DUF4458 domain-containing protein [Bacteroidales bacterium]
MKKQTLTITALTCLIVVSTIWYSCQKEPDNLEKVEVSFNVSSNGNDLIKSLGLKSSQTFSLNDAEKVIITVQKENGSPTDYTLYELDLFKMVDASITKKITLPVGNYKVTEFYVIDALDSIIYASPLEGSLMAQNVSDPLPVLFEVAEKKSKSVNIEVISTKKLKPEDFGLIRFPLVEVETFQFLINASEFGTDQLLQANMNITSGIYSYTQELDSIVDNIATVKDGYTDYILTIESEGYQTFIDTLTNSELKKYDSIPLIVELEKTLFPTQGLIAHYLFDGNLDDELGNYNATMGPSGSFTSGKTNYGLHGNMACSNQVGARADSFPNLETFTISVWIKPSCPPGTWSPTYIIAKWGLHRYGPGFYMWSQPDPGNSSNYIFGFSISDAFSPQKYVYTQQTYPCDSWYHLVGTLNDGNQLKFYINGIEIGSVMDSVGLIANSQPLTFHGALQTSCDWGMSEISLDEVRIYDRVLNLQEIQALYNE